MDRLTRRAEAEGIKAVYYGKNDVFLEGEPGYAEANKLAHYEDLEESGRLVVLPEGYTIEGMAECANQRSLACPSDIGLPSPLHCNHTSCYKCWEAALKGGGQDE